MEHTLNHLFTKILKEGNNKEEIIFTKTGDSYTGVTREKLLSKAVTLNKKLLEMGLKKDDKVAIISENRVEWVITDLACIMEGIVTAPIYNSLNTEQIKFILKDSDAKICFAANTFLLEKVLSVKNDLPSLKYVVSYNDFDEMERKEEVLYFSELFANAGDNDLNKNIKYLEKKSANVHPSDLLTIIYTSGTTGDPKGVMLSHNNVYSNLIASMKVLEINDKDVFLSFLPYSHIYERVAGYYLALFSGAKIYYAKNIDTIGVQMAEAKPTFVITVPRLLDKMYYKMKKAGDELSGLKKKIYNWGMKVAQTHREKKSSVKWKLADTLVFKKIKAKTGGRIRHFVSGGGALNKEIGELFDGIGIQTLEGYGMTESSPVIAVNRPRNNKFGTVGLPLEGVQVRIADDGEILVKGDLVMQGYYKQEEETSKTIVNGWLHTGDIGEIDKDGFVKITDRKKSLFKTSGGKYVAPAQVEDAISRLPYIEQVIAIGNGRMYVTALIVPNYDELKSAFKDLNLKGSPEEISKNPSLLAKIESDLKKVQKSIQPYEKVRKFTLLQKPFTIESGEMTPTMKIKRKVVEEKYKDVIEEMYYEV